MRKSTIRLRLSRETLRTLDADNIRQIAAGAPSTGPTDCVMNDDGGGGTGGSVTCSVPFCPTLYPNTCASIGC